LPVFRVPSRRAPQSRAFRFLATEAKPTGFIVVDKDELLAQSDISSLKRPLMPAALPILNADHLSSIKRGDILIITSCE